MNNPVADNIVQRNARLRQAITHREDSQSGEEVEVDDADIEEPVDTTNILASLTMIERFHGDFADVALAATEPAMEMTEVDME